MQRPTLVQVPAKLLAASLLLISSHSVLAQRAGVVEFSVGDVVAEAANGGARNLVKNSEVLSGDRIKTRSGRAQIRFADGAFISLVPDTEFHVRNYRYDGRTDGSETSFLSILKGTVRAVSGLIGKTNRSRFEIQTPTATLGIRGTGGIIDVAADGTTKVTATEGVWELKNNAGTMEVPAGVTGVATPNTSAPPRRTQEAVTGAPASSRGERRGEARSRDGRDGEGRNEQGPREARGPDARPVPPPPPIVSGDSVNGSGQSVAASGGGTMTTPPPSSPPPMTISGAMTLVRTTTYQHFSGDDLDPAQSVVTGTPPTPIQLALLGGTTYALAGAGTVQYERGSYGTDMTWSRWTGTFDATIAGTYQPVTLNMNEGYHVFAGTPTAQAQLPTTGTISFTHVGGTNPTFSNGTLAPGAFIAGANPMSIDFATGKVAFSFQVDFNSAKTGGSPLTINVDTGPLASSPISLEVNVAGNKPFFNGALSSANVTGISAGGPNGSLSCAMGCLAEVKGALVGTGVQGVGLGYTIKDLYGTGAITGVSAYKR